MTQLARWEPWRELSHMREKMDRLLDEGFGRTLRPDGDLLADWVPAIDVYEEDAEIHLRAELPGMTEKDVEITVENGQLTLKGEKKQEHKEGNDHFRRVESFYGSFYRRFPLPVDVDADKIDAKMKNGVLEVDLPKAESAKPKQIKVKVA